MSEHAKKAHMRALVLLLVQVQTLAGSHHESSQTVNPVLLLYAPIILNLACVGMSMQLGDIQKVFARFFTFEKYI